MGDLPRPEHPIFMCGGNHKLSSNKIPPEQDQLPYERGGGLKDVSNGRHNGISQEKTSCLAESCHDSRVNVM